MSVSRYKGDLSAALEDKTDLVAGSVVNRSGPFFNNFDKTAFISKLKLKFVFTKYFFLRNLKTVQQRLLKNVRWFVLPISSGMTQG